jgi:hypothetical protein
MQPSFGCVTDSFALRLRTEFISDCVNAPEQPDHLPRHSRSALHTPGASSYTVHMPEHPSNAVDTIGKLMAWGSGSVRAFGYCLDCRHTGDISLSALAEKVGAD